MDTQFKKWLIGEFRRGCRHDLMSEKLKCSECGNNFKRVQAIYNREVKKNPQIVRRTFNYPDSPELNEMRNALAERLKKDPMYKKHLELSFKGTPAEKKRENERANKGYYTRHSDYQPKKWL